MRGICSECFKARYEKTVLPEFDVGPCIDLDHLIVRDFPAEVCPNCGNILTDGRVLERIVGAVLADMLRHKTLTPKEAKYLRLNTLDTQQEFADHLGGARATVNRWETGAVVLDGTTSIAVRSHVFFRVYRTEERIRDLLEDLPQYFADAETPEQRTAARIIRGRLVTVAA
jgi:YgiT-type zinc finger domain-containing protein